MPTFCRHSRLATNCSICSKKARTDLSAVRGASEPAKRERKASSAKPRGTTKRQAAAGITVRRLERAVDDGYDSDLLPGLRASVDAARLARELVISAERLEAIQAFDGDVEEGLWLAFQRAVVGRSEVLVTAWFSGENPAMTEAGPRGVAGDQQLALWSRYRSWAGESQLSALTAGAVGAPEARFDRAFERLSAFSLPRAVRLELLLSAHLAGLMPDIEVWTLRLGDAAATDPVLIAAKRIFGIGDPLLLQRRLRAACDAAGIPVAAADVALWNWSATSDGQRVFGETEPDAERVGAAAAAFGAADSDVPHA